MGQNDTAEISLTYADHSERTAILGNHSLQKYRNALDNFDNKVPEVIVPNNYNFENRYNKAPKERKSKLTNTKTMLNQNMFF